jgi:hypothetical protein
MERRLAEFTRVIDRMNDRAGQIESQLNSLARLAIKQDNALQTICEVLKDLDDPYGFGQSVDERVLGDGTSRTCDDEET